MSIHKRLERLEASAGAKAELRQNSRLWERFLHTHEQARREIEGREPLPDLSYTDEDRADDEDTLAATIPAYRTSPGYQSGRARLS